MVHSTIIRYTARRLARSAARRVLEEGVTVNRTPGGVRSVDVEIPGTGVGTTVQVPRQFDSIGDLPL